MPLKVWDQRWTPNNYLLTTVGILLSKLTIQWCQKLLLPIAIRLTYFGQNHKIPQLKLNLQRSSCSLTPVILR